MLFLCFKVQFSVSKSKYGNTNKTKQNKKRGKQKKKERKKERKEKKKKTPHCYKKNL